MTPPNESLPNRQSPEAARRRPSSAPARRAAANSTLDQLQAGSDAFELLPDSITDRFEDAEAMTEKGLKLIKKNPILSKAIKEALKKHKLNFRFKKAEKYLAIAVKESGLNPTIISKSDARGLYQLKVDALDDLNRIFPSIGFTMSFIYHASPEGFMQRRASTHNAMAGILYWHLCRDNYVPKVGTFATKDREKFANIAYKMGPTQFKLLHTALGSPTTFRKFAIDLAEKLAAKYPNALAIPTGKSESIEDPTYKIPYTRYLKVKANISGQIDINGQSFNAANVVQTLRYAELISTMMHGIPKQPKIKAAPEKKDYFEVGKNGKWLWSIASIIYKQLKLDDIPYLKKQKNTTAKLKILMEIIIRYNKEVKDNEDLQDIDPTDLKVARGTKIYPPTKKYVTDFIKQLQKLEEPEKPVKPRALSPVHHLENDQLTIENYPDTAYTIDTSAVEKKVTLKVTTKRGISVKTGKPIERSQVQIRIGDHIGYFCLKNPRTLSRGPINHSTIWTHYDLDFDFPNSKITIKPLPQKEQKPEKIKKPPVVEEPQTPESIEKEPVKKTYVDPTGKLDLSWPKGVTRRNPGPGEIIYIGKDGKKLMAEGKKLHSPKKLPAPKYTTPSWLNPNKGHSKHESSWKPMGKIRGVVLHATEGIVNRQGAELFQRQNTHFLIKEDGSIWQIRDTKYETNHTGYMGNKKGYRAIWNGDRNPYKGRIGIEVETLAMSQIFKKGLASLPVRPDEDGNLNIENGYTTNPPRQADINKAWQQVRTARAYNDKQYETLNYLLKYLAGENKIKKREIISHAMTGVQKYVEKRKDPETGRKRVVAVHNFLGRKFDPNAVDWKRLDLPDNERQINVDVARGEIDGHLKRTSRVRMGEVMEHKGKKYKVRKYNGKWHYVPDGGFGSTNEMYAGAKAGQLLCEKYGTCVSTNTEKTKTFERVIPLRAQTYGLKPAQLEKMFAQKKIKIDSDMTYYEAVLHNISPKASVEVPPQMRVVNVLYYSTDAKIHKGQIVIHRKLVYDIKKIFALAFKMKFPILKAVPISHPWYKWNDKRSVTANNTSAFNYRTIAGTEKLSNHAKGTAIDINPRINPFIGKNGKVTPAGAEYDPKAPGALHANHPIVKEFKRLGWTWGGDWEKVKDYQHFEKPL